MSDAGEMYSEAGEELIRSKRGMKKIFGKAKLKKDGTPGKTVILPPIDEIQTDPEQRETWIEYSALDAQATWFLRESLEAKLRGIDCEACPVLSKKPTFRRCSNLWDFYVHYLREFGEVLTDMESNGMYVDKAHLANAEKRALEDKKVAEDYFRTWATGKCPAAEHMNVGSGIQVRQLLFAGAPNKRRDKPGVEKTREFAMVSKEWTEWDENGREGKAPKKAAKFELHGITKRNLQPPVYTTTGLPAPPSHTRYAFATVAGSGFDTRVTRDAFGCESRRCETTSAAEIVAEGPRAALASAETRAQKSTKESHSFVERRGATSLAAAMFAACGACVGSFGSSPRRSIILAAIVWSWSKSMSSVAGDGGTACDVPCDKQTPLPRDLRAASSSHRASQPIAAGNWTTWISGNAPPPPK